MAITQILSQNIKNLEILNEDINAAAAIVESKLALNFATHDNVNDPSATQKAALDATTGASGANPFATQSDLAGISGSYASPVQTPQNLRDVSAPSDKQMRLVEDNGAIYRFDAQATGGVDDGTGTILPTAGTGEWFRVTATSATHTHTTGDLTDWSTKIGSSLFTANNYLTDGESVTASLEALDVAAGNNAASILSNSAGTGVSSSTITYTSTNYITNNTTLKAAIEALDTSLSAVAQASNDAAEIVFNNTVSGLTAVNVQTAIDEVEGRVDALEQGGGASGTPILDTSVNGGLSGLVNGTNTAFTLSQTPKVAANLLVFNGALPQTQGGTEDYTFTGTTITFAVAPQSGVNLQVSYAY